jgi:hypothetical protein
MQGMMQNRMRIIAMRQKNSLGKCGAIPAAVYSIRKKMQIGVRYQNSSSNSSSIEVLLGLFRLQYQKVA